MYKIVSLFDGNDEHFLTSKEKEKALFEALTLLGWSLVWEKDDDDDDDDVDESM